MVGAIGSGVLGLVFGGILTILLVYILRGDSPKKIISRLLKQYLPLFGSEGIIGTGVPLLIKGAGLDPSTCIPCFWIGMGMFMLPSFVFIVIRLLKYTDWTDKVERTKQLPNGEKGILKDRLENKMTTKQIAQKYGMSEVEVERVIAGALRKIKSK